MDSYPGEPLEPRREALLSGGLTSDFNSQRRPHLALLAIAIVVGIVISHRLDIARGETIG